MRQVPYDQIHEYLTNRGTKPLEVGRIQNGVRRLREIFNGAPPFTVPYDRSCIREAYMVAYYPGHVRLLSSLLTTSAVKSRLAGVLGQKDHVRVSVIGGGPLPELISIAHFVKNVNPTCRQLSAHVFDREIGWKDATTRVTFRALTPATMNQMCFGHAYHPRCDFGRCDETCSDYRCCSDSLAESHLVVMQNFISEIVGGGIGNGAFCRSVEFALDRMQNAGCLLICDLHRYPIVSACLDLVVGRLGARPYEIADEHGRICDSPEDTPEWMREILNGQNGLVPRKYLNYRALLVDLSGRSSAPGEALR